MNTAIRVENLGKTYKIFDRPGDRLKEIFDPYRRKFHQQHVALEGLSFEIKKGEFVGIVGRNGAGKSTLLKLLSGELSPTAGTIEVFGSLALLQLGVGFDQELSGFENAKFALALMNIPGARVEQTLADIAQFADIGDFMNHPVKTYSSGMYSRLAFAIAVNVDPDTLIVDEVLAVGDIRFSQKCLRKMREFKERGKTVILVTHDVGAVDVFCDRAIWIKDGRIFQIGDKHLIAENYSNYMLYNRLPGSSAVVIEAQPPAPTPAAAAVNSAATSRESIWRDLDEGNCIGGEKIRIKKVSLIDESTGRLEAVVKGDANLRLQVLVEALEDVERPYCGWLLNDRKGLIALHLNTSMFGSPMPKMAKGTSLVVNFSFRIPNLNNGDFIFAMAVGQGNELDHRVHDILPIMIANKPQKEEQLGYVKIKECNCEVREYLSTEFNSEQEAHVST